MGTLYIDRKDLLLKLDGRSIAFYAAGQREGIVPINPLKRVIIAGDVTVETPVLHLLARENISVLFLSGKRLSFSGMLHGRLHNNGLLRVRQYEKSLSDFAFNAAKGLVVKKLENQISFFEDARNERPDLRLPLTDGMEKLGGIVDSVRRLEGGLDSLLGLEGGAASVYFSAFIELFPPSLEFNKRNRRPPEDPVNAMLSLCYTLLHYEMVREIQTIGLDPIIGFYHQFDYGRESLACDLVEPHRPAVDRFVWGIFREREFSARDFAEDDERPGCYLKKQSRKRFYPMYEEWAASMRPAWRQEVRQLAKEVLDGQDPVSE